ncbi:hypothetical protein [Amycolatopsis magusensis]|uniref:hypothetical protein n=1 Tax=Amycolatopsis magusensis TaxID=882444 RepID=UPI003798579F
MARKTPTVVPAAGGIILPKLIGTAVLLALLVMVVRRPAETAAWVTDVFGWGVAVIDGLAAFFGHISG